MKLWYSTIRHPRTTFGEIDAISRPTLGLWSVLVRFVITGLTTFPLLWLLGYQPFIPSYITFIATEDYYLAEIIITPLFGLGIWLLGSSGIYLMHRSSKDSTDFDKILNITGFGLLVPMPFVWLWDWFSIGAGFFGFSWAASFHIIFKIWETSLFYIGFRDLLDCSKRRAAFFAIWFSVLSIFLAMLFIRA